MAEEDLKYFVKYKRFRMAFWISFIFNALLFGGAFTIEALSLFRTFIILLSLGIGILIGYLIAHKKPAVDAYEIIERIKEKKKQEDLNYNDFEVDEVMPRKWALYLPSENLLLGYDVEKDKIFREARGKTINEWQKEIEESKLKTRLIEKEEAVRLKEEELGLREEE